MVATRDAVDKLVMGRDLTPYPERLVKSTPNSPHVLIVGAGVTGLVTAWVLLDRGYKVTILSNGFANFGKQRLTSQIAGALWEYPPAVCGSHTDTVSLAHSKRWCMTAYHAWDKIAADPIVGQAAGVRMMEEIRDSGVRGFRHVGTGLVGERDVEKSYQVGDAYEVLSPIIDTDQAMLWLTSLVLGKGASTVTENIADDLLDLEEGLLERFGADAIVNATGLSGSTVAGDKTCYPLRGALIRVINDGQDFPKVEAALTISADAALDGEIIFLVPRNDNILLIGGVAQPHKGTLDMTLDDPAIVRMRQRAEKFLPALKNARLDEDYPLAQGLRPCRGKNVRVEREIRRRPGADKSSRIVHNYGHGGSGWSLSFGCAADVLDLIEDALRGDEPVPMAESGVVVCPSCHVHIRSK
ncbi:FAD-dependent oxidoreductase [Mycena indigotica]|uniref:FAD-dependent oxidoreductase n=1 Tax=Mycena indigotica TaxID=2126181 RepID=A0A8H6SU57_9AGAR|nr:FAD-dependent oxidoreductase [Mycena indigotica]KAF7303985.1 FAD-dependent oxidoreductase [Mycena indigotica]